MRRLRVTFLAMLGSVVPAAAAAQFRHGNGLTVKSVKQRGSRLVALVVTTKALPDPLNVYILLPPDYASQLRIEVPLGPPNPYQQDTAQAQAAGTAVYTTAVQIRGSAR